MCVYEKDNPDWFREAVNSIWNQSIKPAEVVIVVDGPVPEQLNKIITQFEKETVFKVIRLKENKGHGEARRIGLENCKYNLVALMDADDISVYERFENQIKMFVKDPELDIVGGNITEFVETTDNVVSRRIVPTDDRAIKEYMKVRCPMNQMTVMFKKKSVIEAGGYRDWYCNEDYYLWVRMYLKNMHFANIDDTLVHVRIGKEMYRRRGGWPYFVSEWKLQKYMKENAVIDDFTYRKNIAKRFIVQVLMPNQIRGWAFQKFARESME